MVLLEMNKRIINHLEEVKKEDKFLSNKDKLNRLIEAQ